jgi:hypothetical protein
VLLERWCVAWRDGVLPGQTVCCLERWCVAWRDGVLHIQAMLPGDTVYCLCRGYVSWRKAILPEFLCVFLPQFPPGTCRETISNLTTITYLHVPSISLLIDNRTVWHQCNTLRIIGSVIKYTINKPSEKHMNFVYQCYLPLKHIGLCIVQFP